MSKEFLYLNLRKINYPALLYMLKVGFSDNTEVKCFMVSQQFPFQEYYPSL